MRKTTTNYKKRYYEVPLEALSWDHTGAPIYPDMGDPAPQRPLSVSQVRKKMNGLELRQCDEWEKVVRSVELLLASNGESVRPFLDAAYKAHLAWLDKINARNH